MDARTSKWLRYLGYPFFFFVVFVFSVHLTLPYEAIKARLVDEAHKQGYTVSIGSLGPALGFGVTAKQVMINVGQPKPDQPDAPVPALMIDSVTLTPSLLLWGIKFTGKAFGGDLRGFVGPRTKTPSQLTFHGKNFALARIGTKPL